VILNENKTDEPRDWDVDRGVLDALRTWRDEFCATATQDDRVCQQGGVPLSVAGLAKQLRHDLKAVGVNREKLFERSPARLPIRAHDPAGDLSSRSLSRPATPRPGWPTARATSRAR
jgi:hypothetical protein